LRGGDALRKIANMAVGLLLCRRMARQSSALFLLGTNMAKPSLKTVMWFSPRLYIKLTVFFIVIVGFMVYFIVERSDIPFIGFEKSLVDAAVGDFLGNVFGGVGRRWSSWQSVIQLDCALMLGAGAFLKLWRSDIKRRLRSCNRKIDRAAGLVASGDGGILDDDQRGESAKLQAECTRLSAEVLRQKINEMADKKGDVVSSILFCALSLWLFCKSSFLYDHDMNYIQILWVIMTLVLMPAAVIFRFISFRSAERLKKRSRFLLIRAEAFHKTTSCRVA
jgi:hypothetical protein